MDFLDAVNRVLVNNTIIKGDDDLVTTFSDSQHEATIRFARNAITSELNNLAAFFSLPVEKVSSTITTAVGTRQYSLPADFVKFWGDNPFLYLDSDNTQRCYEYRGGEEKLRQDDYRYLTNEGYEQWWYFEESTANKKINLYQVPDAIRTWNYDYEKTVGVSVAADNLPFQNELEAEAFADMCARRFKFMIGQNDVQNLELDAEYIFSRSTLFNLIGAKRRRQRYGRQYR